MSYIYKKSIRYIGIIFALLVVMMSIGSVQTYAAGNIDSVNKYAQFLDQDINNDATNDRINFNPTNGGVTISATGSDGYAWGETVGWINTNPTNGNVDLTCSSGTGTFSGYWWGENAGWINLAPTNGGLTINSDGEFNGDIWSENYGWIDFTCPGSDTCVETTYSCGTPPPPPPPPPGTTPATCSLSASDTSIAPGDSVTISWTTNIPGTGNYTTEYISPIGQVDGDSGSIVVYPNSTTTYDADFAGNFRSGTASCDVTVEVLPINPPPVYGCTDITATNYNSLATISNNSCSYNNNYTYGCTDPLAINYSPSADIDNNSCTYPGDIYGCTDSDALNYNSNADIDNGSCTYPGDIPGCMDSGALNYNSAATISNNSCLYLGDIDGCTDIDALNYNSDANIDDGSCTYPPDGDNDGNSDNPSAYIEEDTYVTSEDDDSVSVTVLRSGPIDEEFDAILQITNGTAFHGSDFDGVLEYQIHWDAGDDTPQVITLDIVDDAEIEGRENFTAMLLNVSGGPLDNALIAIRDNDFPWHKVASIAGLIALLSGLTSLPFRIQNILLAIPAYRRRHPKWGVAFDSFTQEPLDPAYVQLFDAEGNEKGSAFTDLDGRFAFVAEPGTYYMSSGKTDYEFPSKKLAGKKSTSFYENLYFGETIDITEKGQVITKNIPMDPHGVENWNQKAKRSMKVNQFFNRHDGIAHRFIDILFIVGLLITVYAVSVAPVWYNILIAGLYAVTIVINILGVTGRAYGKIRDVAGRVIKGAVVRAFNAHLDKEVAHRVVGESGYYHMLVQKGDYYVTVEVPDGQGGHRHVHTSPNFKANDGVIRRNVKLDL